MKTAFEKNENYSATYQESLTFYHELARQSDNINITSFGKTDSGYPLHEIVISTKKNINSSEQEKKKAVILINNAIHPGEPCGVDASMILARDILYKDSDVLENVVVVIIPIYNISGALNRGNFSRANQLGPESHGFRGNIRNYDLNRDFIKCDTRNAQTFNQLFQKWNPDIFIDTHTSNGADYQYIMTLIATQKDKLGKTLGKFLDKEMLPYLYDKMENAGYEMIPYVNVRNTPDDGIYGFLDLPRYSSGYAALHHTLSFMPETHMLKPYKDRVWSTYHFLLNTIKYANANHQKIHEAREKAIHKTLKAKQLPIAWKLDQQSSKKIQFKGYEARYKPSEISGQPRLYYDHDQPYQKKIDYFNEFEESILIQKPKAYILPQAYEQIKKRLLWNGVSLQEISQDTSLSVEAYFIESFETVENPYEGHYLHYDVKIRKEKIEMPFRVGDYIIPLGQKADRFLVETLEPQAPDSFFAWNFMDAILQRKEYFSSYIFEEVAIKLLQEDKHLRKELEEKKSKDPDFAKDALAQLMFIYERSLYAEPSYRRYPVYRLME